MGDTRRRHQWPLDRREGKILLPIAEKYLKVLDLFNETIAHCEKHGIRDKGGTKEHQYLVLKS